MGTQRDNAHPDSPPPPSPVTSRRPYSPLGSIQDGPVVRVGGGGVGYSGSGGEGFGGGGVGSGGARGGLVGNGVVDGGGGCGRRYGGGVAEASVAGAQLLLCHCQACDQRSE